MSAYSHMLPAGYGATIGVDFWRASVDTPVRIASGEYMPSDRLQYARHVVCYRQDGVRLVVNRDCLKPAQPLAASILAAGPL